MLIDGQRMRTIRRADGQAPFATAIEIVDQTRLPYELVWRSLSGLGDVVDAIRVMQVRGAPLIGVTAAYGMALALAADAEVSTVGQAAQRLVAARPTAVNLHWAVQRMLDTLLPLPASERRIAAWRAADALAEEDVRVNRAIGEHGLQLLQALPHVNPRLLRVMTHCNAGALATVEWGTALAPLYLAQEQGIAIHVWVSETRPRNQGLLTAWELKQAGIAHTVVCDNSAAWLMATGQVDAVIVGADRIAANGDTANKIGTSLKAWAAQGYRVPFYVAAPTSTIDRDCVRGEDIEIEMRAGDEVRRMTGLGDDGVPARIALLAAQEAVVNPSFDVTPARLIGAFITEKGVLTVPELQLPFCAQTPLSP